MNAENRSRALNCIIVVFCLSLNVRFWNFNKLKLAKNTFCLNMYKLVFLEAAAYDTFCCLQVDVMQYPCPLITLLLNYNIIIAYNLFLLIPKNILMPNKKHTFIRKRFGHMYNTLTNNILF